MGGEGEGFVLRVRHDAVGAVGAGGAGGAGGEAEAPLIDLVVASAGAEGHGQPQPHRAVPVLPVWWRHVPPAAPEE